MRIWLLTAALVATLSASARVEAVEPDTPEPAAQEPLPLKSNPALRAVLEKLRQPESNRDDADSAERAALLAYYTDNVDHPIWVTQRATLKARANALIAELDNAGDWGLSPKDFTLPRDIAGLVAASKSGGEPPPETLAKIEIAVSTVALRYARHARGGRIPDPAGQLSSYLDRKPVLLPPGTILDALRRTKPHAIADYLHSLHPQHPQFERLRKALLALRAGKTREQKPEDIKLPASGPLLRLGRTHADVALLRKRLSVPTEPRAATPTPTPQNNENKNDPPDPAEVYDQVLKDAVKAFQRENGLSPDGLVGRGTRRALNNAGASAITPDALIANMEAWRWMPENLGDTYVTVNIPEFKVRVVKAGRVIHEERAIVGKTNNQTPVFSDEMESIVIHPSWGVPNSIKVREIWPSLSRGGDVLRRQNLRLKRNGRIVNPNSINWAYADIRNYDVYQPPGSRNVLGIVKFLFPNRHQVYMHDTPTKNLFNEPVRTFSHGCMRLQNPVRLAEIVLAADRNWTAEHVGELIASGPKQNKIVLETKVPVHTTYFTIVIDDDGTAQRHKDIYGHEQRIKLAVAGQFDRIARGRDHLAPVRYTRRNTGYQSVNDILKAVFGGF